MVPCTMICDHVLTDAAVQSSFLKKVFGKYEANLQKNTHAEVRF